MGRDNRCPRCGRSRGSMTHKTKCLGHSRGAERAKNREAAARRRAGLVRGSRAWWGGSGSPSAPAIAGPTSVGLVADGSFYTDRAAAASTAPAAPAEEAST